MAAYLTLADVAARPAEAVVIIPEPDPDEAQRWARILARLVEQWRAKQGAR